MPTTTISSVNDTSQSITLDTSFWLRISGGLFGNHAFRTGEASLLVSIIMRNCGIIPPIDAKRCVDKLATKPGSYQFRVTRAHTFSQKEQDWVRRALLVLELGPVVITTENDDVNA
jgi:hypothetical protein